MADTTSSHILQLHAYNSSNVLFVAALGFVLYVLYAQVLLPRISLEGRFWRNVKWVGLHDRFFARLRAEFNSITGSRGMIQHGYDQYSKKNQAFALPSFGNKPMVVIPAEKVQSLSHQPESIMSFDLAGRKAIAVEYTGDLDLEDNPFHFDIVRKQLTRKLPLLTADVYSELVLGMQDQWPATKDGWVTVPAYESCIKIVSRAANRVFCGTELCRNQEFLDAIREYTQGVFGGAFMINMLPKWLRPVIAPIITRPNRKPLDIARRFAMPVIKQRLAALQKAEEAGVSDSTEVPTDALQWLLEDAMKQNDPAELDPEKLARRIIRLNMVAIHTTSLTVLGTLLDILSSPDRDDIVAGIRDEAEGVLVRYGEWNKAAVNDLHRVDSCLKESMRVSGLGLIGMMRIVTAEQGADLGDGIHIPKDVMVVAAQRAIHLDPQFYHRPEEYDAFRFSRAREAASSTTSTASRSGQDQDLASLIDAKGQAVITTSDRFLGFGHGKHACPGRFFASQEMKLMLAHAMVNYDLRLKASRIVRDISVQQMPDDKAQIEVRVRSDR